MAAIDMGYQRLMHLEAVVKTALLHQQGLDKRGLLDLFEEAAEIVGEMVAAENAAKQGKES